MYRVSRRTFLSSAVAAAGAAAVGRRSYGATLPTLAGSTRLESFDYGDVQLLDGPMLEQFRANHAYFLALNDDSLLQPFRQRRDCLRRASRWAVGTAGRRISIHRRI